MHTTLLAALLIGCGPGKIEPAPYTYDPPPPPAPELTPEQVGAAIDEVLPQLLSWTAAPVLDGYHAATAFSDEDCPAWYEEDGNVFWYDSCEAESGAQFEGYGFGEMRADETDGAWNFDYDTLSASATIVTPDGTFTAGGGAQMLTGYSEADEAELYQSYIDGSFGWTGTESDGTWLMTEVSPSLFLQVYRLPELDGAGVWANGGVGGLTGAVDTIEIGDLYLVQEEVGGLCPDEPSGSISVRDDTGNWYDVLFDDPNEEGVGYEPVACDGCGAVYYRGSYLGEACADFSVLFDFDGAPWDWEVPL